MRRPIFWFLWPAAEPGPVDGDAVQVRWIRICGRGPWRWAFLIVSSAAVVTLSSAALAVVITAPSVLALLISMIVVIPLVALLARAWVAGTYVSDHGIKVSRILTTEVAPWTDIADIAWISGSRWLGLPLRVSGEHAIVQMAAGMVGQGADAPYAVATHVETASPDLWLRPQAWAAASDRMRTWLREARG